MRILYTGALKRGSLTAARLRALQSLGHDVAVVDQVPFIDHAAAVVRKVQTHLSVGPGVSAYNRAILSSAAGGRWDLIYVDQACYLTPATVRRLREHAPVVQYTSDYFGFHRHSFRRLLSAVEFYDAHVITNDLNREELERRGANVIVTTGFGFDPELHRPVQLTDADREAFGSDVTFVGHWEPMSERRISALRDAGIAVRVWGAGWTRSRLADRRSIEPVYEEDYVRVLASSKICLCLLSKWNHNLSASRTFEIPAVGSFLLAERTADHQAAFEEGREAEFFSTDSELVEKAARYLRDEPARRAVASAGHWRCRTSGYTHRDRVVTILEDLRRAGVMRPLGDSPQLPHETTVLRPART